MIGLEFGKLIVKELVGTDQNNHRLYRCKCACGKEKIIRGTGLRRKNGTKSCGCLLTSLLQSRNYKHGNKSRTSRSREYISWVAMIQRCTNPKHKHYHKYGGRGVVVCDEWFEFQKFLDDMGQRPNLTTLGRINDSLVYDKLNCKWMTNEEQTCDRVNNTAININGEIKTVSDWCKLYRIAPNTVRARIRRNWNVLDAVTTPAKEWKTSMSKLSHEEMSRIGKSNVRRGKSLERRVANLFTDWSGVQFRRRRVEGRDSTVIERESTADVIPVTGDIHFSIEVKCGILTSFDGLMSDPINNIFTKHWHQACYDAKLVSDIIGRKIYPFLFFKPHTNFDWVAVSQEPFKNGILSSCDDIQRSSIWFPALSFDYYALIGNISHNISHTKNKRNHVPVPLLLDPLYLCRWKDFTENVNPSSLFVSSMRHDLLTSIASITNELSDRYNIKTIITELPPTFDRVDEGAFVKRHSTVLIIPKNEEIIESDGTYKYPDHNLTFEIAGKWLLIYRIGASFHRRYELSNPTLDLQQLIPQLLGDHFKEQIL